MTKFLVVDDSATIRLTLRSALRNILGPMVDVREAGDAGQAISEFRIFKPDVIFLDMILAKGTGGKDVLKMILQELPSAKVVVCTGLPANHEDVVEAVSDGAFAYFQKPVRSEAIKKVLTELDVETGRAGRIR